MLNVYVYEIMLTCPHKQKGSPDEEYQPQFCASRSMVILGLYHIKPYGVYPLMHCPYIGPLYGSYLQFRSVE